jgi:anti-sigma B factor antagonist
MTQSNGTGQGIQQDLTGMNKPNATRSHTMNISNDQHGNVDLVKLPQRLIMENSMAVRKALLELIDTGHRHLVLDLGKVEFVDSSGLSVLVSALKAATKTNGSVVLVNLTDDVRALIELTRMHEVFQIFGDEQAAIDQLNQQVAA